jgi:two-component system, chemotaxis family, CheB/CheR fusion protein
VIPLSVVELIPKTDPLRAERKHASPPVVGIGASAGGIDALNRFFGSMPADSGLAFVVVLHLDPRHHSELASLLGHRTAMPVADIVDGIRIEPNRVYVIVPDKSLRVEGDLLRLSEPAEPRGHRHPVDVFFVSLAEHRRERAIAIVLSGTGSNGTQGMKEVKASGGLAVVQDPATAQFDGMPRSVVTAGAADHVTAPEKMPEILLRYARHGYMADPDGLAAEASDAQPVLDPVVALLRACSGHDFRNYRRGTLERRIHRRMGLTNRGTLAEYAELLRSNPGEIAALVKDLMISVTGFFRDPKAWAALDETVLAPLVAERDGDAEIRIWVPACATGEEVYSLAMLVVERARAMHKTLNLKIFATDSQETNLAVARDGTYPAAAVSAISSERLRRFFDRLDGSYQIKKELRELIVFASQNLLLDPPFSRLDLISCRNLLIYLDSKAQKRVVALFHFALREGGHLFLGNAETVGRHENLFDTVSKKWRIYLRVGPTRHDIVEFPVLGTHARLQHVEEPARPEAEPARAAEVARRALLDRYAPASVLIDQKGRILYFHGPTGDYLEQPPGEPTRDLLAMARDGLRQRLRAAVREATEKHNSVSVSAHVRQRDAVRAVSVTVAPLATTQASAGLLLVSFAPESEPRATAHPVPPSDRQEAKNAASQRTLEEELKSTRDELQSTIEQMESTNEELKAANEEATSMNEELQSTNEELETSKEELQSYNEELHTINNQLQLKNQELENLADDQNNLLAGTEVATIFLDMEHRIKWFSPASKGLLDLVPSDIGRPLTHFAPKFDDPNLLQEAQTVLEKLTPNEAEISSAAGRWYLRRLIPYRTGDNRIVGTVLTFTDITDRKHAADAVNEARVYAEAIVDTIRQPLLTLDAELRVQSANRAFCTLFQVPTEDTQNRQIYELGNGQWNIPALRKLFKDVLPENAVIEDFVVEHNFENLGRRIMLINARKLQRPGRPDLILVAIDDITVRSDAEAHRDVLISEMSHRVKNVLAAVQSIASQTLRQSGSLEGFKAAFNGRLHALAGAHDLLVDEGWAGSDMRQLVRRTLEPYAGDVGGRITVDGPKLTLRTQTGVALTMILHELATNAAKYGALSTPHGTLDVNWRREDSGGQPQIRLRWIEAGGPPVKTPSRRGFGSELIERSTTHELHGQAILDYREEGFHGELTFPWDDPSPPGGSEA